MLPSYEEALREGVDLVGGNRRSLDHGGAGGSGGVYSRHHRSSRGHPVHAEVVQSQAGQASVKISGDRQFGDRRQGDTRGGCSRRQGGDRGGDNVSHTSVTTGCVHGVHGVHTRQHSGSNNGSLRYTYVSEKNLA